ncbi:TetR family transcriptional regulator [Halolamina sp. CBA1230]|uniref:TetR/AcrR family transcriptional regulator n=1 Tax=Halolamina sp. CBA1230 TaxID=1853690 RepID=UPI0009A253CA|nr:TetR/AcrR family transcriptional regulator [Halolamina sp. CBA1230]QKY19896.1 TetR family transcriptional regulator [Halolamina sp. CBA1230]
MGETPPFLADPETTRESIMRATYLALCEHGYAGLTIQRIGEAFEKSKSLLYHHYDDKDELLLAFLQFMLEEHEASLPETADGDAVDRLERILDGVLPPSLPEEHRGFTAAMVELRAQAAHDERYREQFAEHDRVFRDQLADIVEDGIESGAFREVDPEPVAEFISTTVAGAMTRRVTGGDDTAASATRDELEAYVDRVLLADD